MTAATRPLWMSWCCCSVPRPRCGVPPRSAGRFDGAPAPTRRPALLGPGGEPDRPSFTALALLALASLAGVFAVGGWARRLLGAIIVVAGGCVCWRAIGAAGGFDLLTGRGLALLGGVLLFAAAGVSIVWYAAGCRRWAPGTSALTRNAVPAIRDKDMWDGLSDGEDPTRRTGPRT